MRTTMSFDDKLMKELMDVTGAATKTEAVHLAIAEFIRRKKLEGLKALSGKVRIADNWQELEELEHRSEVSTRSSGRSASSRRPRRNTLTGTLSPS